MANKPHHGMRGLMAGPAAMKAGAHMPLRKPSGGDRKAKTSPTARNGALAGGKLQASATSDTRRRIGAEGNAKGSPPTNLKSPKPASLESHKGTAGRGGKGELRQMDTNRLSESPGSEWFEKLGA